LEVKSGTGVTGVDTFFLAVFSEEDLIIALTSAILITGKNLANNKNKVKNNPKENT
jgi:hypothetical protein